MLSQVLAFPRMSFHHTKYCNHHHLAFTFRSTILSYIFPQNQEQFSKHHVRAVPNKGNARHDVTSLCAETYDQPTNYHCHDEQDHETTQSCLPRTYSPSRASGTYILLQAGRFTIFARSSLSLSCLNQDSSISSSFANCTALNL